ncbi:MAG TPA: ABC transporter permease [Coriobacteriia bacterium]
MRLLRNIFRRRLRAFLTIFGITIGVLALVVMGAMSEKLTLLVDGGVTYYKGKVIVNEAGATGYAGSAPISTRRVRDLERIYGVARASAQVGMLLDKEPPTVSMGSVPAISASDGRERGYETFPIKMAAGRDLMAGDRKVCVVGSDLVSKLDARVGGLVEIRDEPYRVVGIYARTLTAPDTAVVIPLADAQQIMHDQLPATLRQSLDERTLASSIAVYVKPGVDPDALAAKINRKLPEVKAVGPMVFVEQVAQSVSTLTAIITGIGMISLLVGGLSVINTMTMSVMERTREIGIRKAVGASDGQIMRQFIAEAGVIGLIGGLAGLGLGWLIATGLNAAAGESGTQLFLVTPTLAIGSVSFALILGIASGLYPAYHAATMNPVEALRYE